MFLHFTHYSLFTHTHTHSNNAFTLKGTANVSLASTQHRLPRLLHDENGVSWLIPAKLMSTRFAFGMEERKHYFDTQQISLSFWRKPKHLALRLIWLQRYNSRRFHKYIWIICSTDPPPRRTGAHLYSQKVSSFISCDSTSGWRSSFPFTADEVEEFFCFVLFFATWWGSHRMIPKEPELTADKEVWLFGEDWAEQEEEPRYRRETAAKGNVCGVK